MANTVNENTGYEINKRYERYLELVTSFGSSNGRFVVFVDGDGVEFLWSTTEETKAYQEMKFGGMYRFTIKKILSKEDPSNLPRISIMRVKGL